MFFAGDLTGFNSSSFVQQWMQVLIVNLGCLERCHVNDRRVLLDKEMLYACRFRGSQDRFVVNVPPAKLGGVVLVPEEGVKSLT
jgi:hypothetical protein